MLLVQKIQKKKVNISAEEFIKYKAYQDSVKKQSNFNSISTAAQSQSQSGKHKWVIDSGATENMTGTSNNFLNYQPNTHMSGVTLADG